VRELYGMTEIRIALGVPYHVDEPAIIGTCGVPYPLYEIKVVDDAGKVCPPDFPGEL
jgi:acyl-coenzyme A synthetase/AMP-(fatty) acid ligase